MGLTCTPQLARAKRARAQLPQRGLARELPTRGGALVTLLHRRTELRDQWVPLVQRLALAFLAGILVAGALSWYLSRRITRPVLALSAAADQIAAGNYAVRVPEAPPNGSCASQ